MQEKDIHVRDYIRVILKRKPTIATFFVITFLVVVIGTFTMTPQYLGSTKVLIEKNETDPLYANRYRYSPVDLQFIETQIQIITSKSVARKVVKNLDLGKNYQSYFPEKQMGPGFLQVATAKIKDFIKRGSDILPDTAAISAPPGDGYEVSENEWLTDIIIKGISVSPVKDSKIFIISYMSENPIFARRVANNVVKAYQEELLELKAAASSVTVSWMTQKADEEREKLKESEAKLQQYMRDNDIVTIEDRSTIIPQKEMISSRFSRGSPSFPRSTGPSIHL
jgi:uncharacterized protein involved in exopolysaccharide biosynthesis